jgi:anaerobic selenocysteine-containing dehydrogenase
MCGILLTLDKGKVIKVEGDPDSPFNQGHICPKGRALPELLYHPNRLTQPLKRTGAKGEGK